MCSEKLRWSMRKSETHRVDDLTFRWAEIANKAIVFAFHCSFLPVSFKTGKKMLLLLPKFIWIIYAVNTVSIVKYSHLIELVSFFIPYTALSFSVSSPNRILCLFAFTFTVSIYESLVLISFSFILHFLLVLHFFPQCF